jgi:hypothetical protein
MIAGPKNHCVTNIHHAVTTVHLRAPRTRRGVKCRDAGGPVEGCVKRKKKKLTVTHAQPCFTKNWLKILLFLAKYEGAVLTKCDCVVALYGADRADGSRRAKREPTTRVAGYTTRIILSRYVGRTGGLRAIIFVVGTVPFVILELVDGVDRFWFSILCDRRRDADSEAILFML